jgi:hypothetical protein
VVEEMAVELEVIDIDTEEEADDAEPEADDDIELAELAEEDTPGVIKVEMIPLPLMGYCQSVI